MRKNHTRSSTTVPLAALSPLGSCRPRRLRCPCRLPPPPLRLPRLPPPSLQLPPRLCRRGCGRRGRRRRCRDGEAVEALRIMQRVSGCRGCGRGGHHANGGCIHKLHRRRVQSGPPLRVRNAWQWAAARPRAPPPPFRCAIAVKASQRFTRNRMRRARA